ncbi:amidohydrolase family protein [Streptomyces sp. NPDC127039]|uniref:amidohydrolase family protein n=1 Tax=Streptomyces sp. NPDC127039 TaxID=3347115 RepID=UPI00365A35C3
MLQQEIFRVDDPEWIRDLAHAHPWATLISNTEHGGLVVSHLPVLVERASPDDPDGTLTLLGHLARADALEHELGAHDVAVVLQGPHGYLSPVWYEETPHVPTWNFTVLHVHGRPEILAPDATYDVLSATVDHSELTAVPARVTDQWVREAGAAAAARGVTGIVDFEYADNITDWTRRMSEEGAGAFPLRVAASIWLPQLEGAIAHGLRTGRPLPVPSGLLEVGPFKLLTDGSLNTRTALCHDPYPDRDPEAPGARGLEEVSPGELVSLLRRASGHGITPAVHAIGDRANEMALDAFETVRCRGSVEHGQLLAAKDVPRFAELGVTVSVQPTHAVDDRDVAQRHWAGRTHRAYAFADLLDAGADLALGSDAPVAPLDPWLTIASAVERTADERPPFHPEQRIPVAAALTASSRGRRLVRVGDDADLVVTDTDPLTTDTATLRTMPVHATMLAGAWTHRTS